MKIAIVIFVASLAVPAAAKLTSCSIGGKSYKNNEEYKTGSFMQKCVIDPSGMAWNTETTACLTPEGKRINPESSVTEGSWTYNCNRKDDGNIGMSMASGGSGGGKKGGSGSSTGGGTGRSRAATGGDTMKCTDRNGIVRKNGETWITESGSFEKECVAEKYSAGTKIINCIISGEKFAPDTSKKVGKYTYECKKGANGSVSLMPKLK